MNPFPLPFNLPITVCLAVGQQLDKPTTLNELVWIQNLDYIIIVLFRLVIKLCCCCLSFHSPGNIYTGSPKHVNLDPYQANHTYNSFNLLAPPSILQQQQQQHQSGGFYPHNNALPSHPMMYYSLDTGMTQTGTPFRTPTKKYVLPEMPLEYSQLDSNHNRQQLQDAVTNQSQAMHNTANGNSQSVMAFHSKLKVILMPISCTINRCVIPLV